MTPESETPMFDFNGVTTVARILENGRVYDRIPTVMDVELGLNEDGDEDYFYTPVDEDFPGTVKVPSGIVLRRNEETGHVWTEATTSREVPARSTMLPSLATQWRNDMASRVEAAKRAGSTWGQTRLVAPREFIETGRWPKEA